MIGYEKVSHKAERGCLQQPTILYGREACCLKESMVGI